jgi:hypothetical protein
VVFEEGGHEEQEGGVGLVEVGHEGVSYRELVPCTRQKRYKEDGGERVRE